MPVGLALALGVLVLAIVLLLGAVLIAGRARRQLRRDRSFRAAAVSTTGRIVDVVERSERSHPGGAEWPLAHSFYYAVVEFGLPDGQLVRATSMTPRTDLSYRVGSQVEVRYDPSEPRRAEVPVRGSGCAAPALGLLAVGFAGMALMLLPLAVVLFLLLR